MSLDQNLFTLLLTPNKENPHVVDLVDPSGMVHYRKQRLPGVEYKTEVYDPLSESLLITATAPAPTSKFKTLELRNPTIIVELKYTGTLSFRWGFKWEGHEFEWKREECFMLRKPDPPVLVAITKEPAGRIKTATVQILDYNLNRFDINDRKGLEIVILTALLTFQDSNESYHTPREEGSPNSLTPPILGRKASTPALSTIATPPMPPPKPAPKTGVERIKELQKGDYNEITVEEEGHVSDYAEYCGHLIKDDAILFVTLRSAAAEQVPKVLQVVEQTKRLRHKAGITDELHQYVLYDTKQVGPRRIVLDDNVKTRYTPPNTLTVHLSKIDMPELQPKAAAQDSKQKEDPKRKDESKKKDEPRKKDEPKKEKKKEEKKATKSPSPARSPNKLNKLTHSTSPSSRVHSHQVHPAQPSPSPSQLNNPSIYVAPPPKPPTHLRNLSTTQSPIAFPMPEVPSTNTRNKSNRHSFHAEAGAPNLYNPSPRDAELHSPPLQGLAIPSWQPPSQATPSPLPSTGQKLATSLVTGIFERLQSHKR